VEVEKWCLLDAAIERLEKEPDTAKPAAEVEKWYSRIN
jgi:hypothetical protein